MTWFLRWLGGNVYGSILPSAPNDGGSKTYLEDLWRDAPWPVAAANSAVAVFILFLPPFLLGRFRLFSGLTQSEKEAFFLKLSGSRWYVFRMAANAARIAALVGALRDPAARKKFLGEERVFP